VEHARGVVLLSSGDSREVARAADQLDVLFVGVVSLACLDPCEQRRQEPPVDSRRRARELPVGCALQEPRHVDRHADRRVGIGMQDRHQIVARDRDGGCGLDRLQRCRAALACEQRELADHVAVPQLRKRDRLPVDQAPCDLRASRVQDVAHVAGVAFLEHDRAGVPAQRVHLASQSIDLVVVQRVEQLELAEQRNNCFVREGQTGNPFRCPDRNLLVVIAESG
jgi:hypothetical protein